MGWHGAPHGDACHKRDGAHGKGKRIEATNFLQHLVVYLKE